MNNISTIILTYNEEVNVKQAIESVKDWTDVFVVDSESTDKTYEIAESLKADVHIHKFESYAKQRNWALKSLPIETEWVFFLDADEMVTEPLKNEMLEKVIDSNYDGFHMKYRLYFAGGWITHGGSYPVWLIRLFKKNKGVFQRDTNEHLVIDGTVGKIQEDFIHNDRKGISDWIAKHNRYATYEAEELIKYEKRKKDKKKDEMAKLFGTQAERKRWLREYIWNPLMPPLIRPFFYFFYRYFLKLGFLDGKAGFIYCFLQALWFYFLIDVKYLEMKKEAAKTSECAE